MPELPDIVVYTEALTARIVGQPLVAIKLLNPFLLRTASPSVEAAVGKRVAGISRLGKRLIIALEGELFLVLHLMIAGRDRRPARSGEERARRMDVAIARRGGKRVPGRRHRVSPRVGGARQIPATVPGLWSAGAADRLCGERHGLLRALPGRRGSSRR